VVQYSEKPIPTKSSLYFITVRVERARRLWILMNKEKYWNLSFIVLKQALTVLGYSIYRIYQTRESGCFTLLTVDGKVRGFKF